MLSPGGATQNITEIFRENSAKRIHLQNHFSLTHSAEGALSFSLLFCFSFPPYLITNSFVQLFLHGNHMKNIFSPRAPLPSMQLFNRFQRPRGPIRGCHWAESLWKLHCAGPSQHPHRESSRLVSAPHWNSTLVSGRNTHFSSLGTPSSGKNGCARPSAGSKCRRRRSDASSCGERGLLLLEQRLGGQGAVVNASPAHVRS